MSDLQLTAVINLITSAMEDCTRGCLSVCLLTTSRKNFRTDLQENYQERLAVDKWTNDSVLVAIGIRIATLVRRALAEVCPVPLLLVHYTAIILGLRPL